MKSVIDINGEKWFFEEEDNSTGICYKIVEHLHHSQSPYQTVDVFRTAEHGNLLALDELTMLTEKHEYLYHEMLVHIPMLSHHNPRNALVVGGGDGGTVRELLNHNCIENIDMVEIDEQVVEVSKKYLTGCSGKLSDPRVSIIIEDAIEFVKDIESTYDLILIDSSDPIGPGEGLFNKSFYQNVHRALKSDGVIALQSESPFSLQSDVPTIYRKLRSVFPLVRLYWAPIPCYPYGTWSFIYCSKNDRHPEIRRNEDSAAIEAQCKYYNRDIHSAAFVLPNFMRKFTRCEE